MPSANLIEAVAQGVPRGVRAFLDGREVFIGEVNAAIQRIDRLGATRSARGKLMDYDGQNHPKWSFKHFLDNESMNEDDPKHRPFMRSHHLFRVFFPTVFPWFFPSSSHPKKSAKRGA